MADSIHDQEARRLLATIRANAGGVLLAHETETREAVDRLETILFGPTGGGGGSPDVLPGYSGAAGIKIDPRKDGSAEWTITIRVEAKKSAILELADLLGVKGIFWAMVHNHRKTQEVERDAED